MRFPISFEGQIAGMKRIDTKTGRKMHVVSICFMGGSKDFFFPDNAIPDVLMGQSVRVSCFLNLASFRLEDARIEGI